MEVTKSMNVRLFLTAFLSICVVAGGSDWPRFRGDNGIGISQDQGLPARIDKDKNVIWKVKIPAGNSSPIVVDQRLFLTAHEGEDRFVLCLDSNTGEELWRKKVPKPRSESFHPRNGPTTPTCVSDEDKVFSFFPEFGVIAHDLEGRELWQTPLGPFTSVQGLAASPIYVNGKVVLLIDTPDDAYLAAFDAATGKQVWKTPRETGMLGSYATPTLYEFKDQDPQIIVSGAIELTGYDSTTGRRIWWARGISHFPAGSPFVSGDSVYSVEQGGLSWPPFSEPLRLFDKNQDGKIEFAEMTDEEVAWTRSLKGIDRNLGNKDKVVTKEEYSLSSYDGSAGGMARTKLGGQGNVGKTHVLWRNAKGMPALTSSLLYNDALYVMNDGIFSVLNPETGQVLRKERLTAASGDYYASPVAGDGKIYLVSLKGKVTVLKAGKDWRILSAGDLGEEVIATPAIANQRIYVRTQSNLFCFGFRNRH